MTSRNLPGNAGSQKIGQEASIWALQERVDRMREAQRMELPETETHSPERTPRLIHIGRARRDGKTQSALDLFCEYGGVRGGKDILWFDDNGKSPILRLWGAGPIPTRPEELFGLHPKVIIVSSEHTTDMKIFLSRWPHAKIEKIEAPLSGVK